METQGQFNIVSHTDKYRWDDKHLTGQLSLIHSSIGKIKGGYDVSSCIAEVVEPCQHGQRQVEGRETEQWVLGLFRCSLSSDQMGHAIPEESNRKQK